MATESPAAFAEAGAAAVAVSRTAAEFPEPVGGSGTIKAEIADAGDAAVAARLLERYEPEVVVLVAGASPHMRPLQEQTWETFSVNWQTDVRIAFHWLREALLKPLSPGSRVIVFSSGAALGRLAAQRRLCRRQGHPALHHGVRPGRGEALRSGHHLHRGASPDDAADRPRSAGGRGVRGSRRPVRGGIPASGWGRRSRPEIAGAAVVELVRADAADVAPGYRLTGAGLQKLP